MAHSPCRAVCDFRLVTAPLTLETQVSVRREYVSIYSFSAVVALSLMQRVRVVCGLDGWIAVLPFVRRGGERWLRVCDVRTTDTELVQIIERRPLNFRRNGAFQSPIGN